MKRNKMGNLLSIAGDDAEDIKQFIDSFLSQDSESDDPEEKCVDFCKIIAVADPEDEEEDIKQFIDSFLSQDSESDDPEEKCVDFCKIIAVADSEDEEECLREWGVKQNASNTSVI